MTASPHQSERLPCQSCGGIETRAKDSRQLTHDTQRRRYVCSDCDTRYSVLVTNRFQYSDDGRTLTKTEVLTYVESRKKTVLKPKIKLAPMPILTRWVHHVAGVATERKLNVMEML